MPLDDGLPTDIREGATLRGHEYGWSLSAFPNALARAEVRGYACLGGQFQFRLEDGSTYEMYWLNADSTERMDAESWRDYSRRSCSEVAQGFQHLISHTDFSKETSNWPDVRIDATNSLVFVAYFLTEADWANLDKKPPKK